MEKKFFRFFLILFTIISSFGLASCDDNDVSDAELMEILQQHKWIMRDAELNLYGDDELELRREGHYLYFYSDDEGFEFTITKIIDTEGTDTWNRDFSKFTYSVSDNIVYLRYVGSGNRTLTYSDGNLLYSSIVYVPLSLNSSDSSVIQEGKISGDYNFDYSIGFDHDYMSQPYYSNGKYHWSIPMSFGIPRNTYKRGVRDFGIAVYVSGGTVDNQTKKYSMDAYVTLRKINGQDTKCFSHTVSDDTPQDWDTKLSISTTGKSFTLYYTWFLINKDGDYIDGDSFLPESFEADGTTNDESDDDDTNDNDYAQSIIGRWKYEDRNAQQDYQVFVIKNNGSVSYEWLYTDESTDIGYIISCEGTYKVSGSTLTMTYTDVDVTIDTPYYHNGSFKDFEHGKKATIVYTIVSCSSNKLVLKDKTGKTLSCSAY